METMAAKIPKLLADEVDRLIASGRYANRSEVLRVAVRALLGTEGGAASSRGRPAASPEIEAFERRLKEVAKDPRFRNRWVALHRGIVIDSDDDMDLLVRRVLDRKEEPIHVGLATESAEPLRARLPGVRVKGWK
jgi:Arc/MetJ-type ribon-helix-helix transcriptional regulator